MPDRTARRWATHVAISLVAVVAFASSSAAQTGPTTTTTGTGATPDTTAPGTASNDECALPLALQETKRTDEAVRAYVSVLRANPSSECARDGLLTISAASASTTDPCDVAEDLHEGGSDDVAATVLEEAIKEGVRCDGRQSASELLKDINHEPWPDRVVAWLVSLGKIFAALLLVAIVLALVALAIPPVRLWLRKKLGASIVFDEFGDPSSGPAAGAAVTAVTAAAFAAPASDDLAALRGLDQVDEHMELATAAEGLDKISPTLAPVAGFLTVIDRLVRPVRLTVSGHLLAASAQGAGLTVKMVHTDSAAGSAVLRAGSGEDPAKATEADFERLAGPAAAWARHHAARIVGANTASMRTTALSYAWLCAANAAQERGELEVALDLFERSIEADPTNLRAKAGRALVRGELATIESSLLILGEALAEFEAADVS